MSDLESQDENLIHPSDSFDPADSVETASDSDDLEWIRKNKEHCSESGYSSSESSIDFFDPIPERTLEQEQSSEKPYLSLAEENYFAACATPSDINEHLPTLYHFSKKCKSVCEFGVRDANSTWAFLMGLRNNNSSEKLLLGVDLIRSPMIEKVGATAVESDITFRFVEKNDLDLDLKEPIDLLFIDTWHNAGQLSRELEKHATHVTKYIIMHDTSADGETGESVRISNIIQKPWADQDQFYTTLDNLQLKEHARAFYIDSLSEPSSGFDYSQVPSSFDWKIYMLCNPDIDVSNSLEAIQHYIRSGKYESRCFSLRFDLLPKDFHWRDYLALNRDLFDAGVNTKSLAIRHYLEYGSKEDRCCSKIDYMDRMQEKYGFLALSIQEQSELWGIPEDEIKRGLKYAISEFLVSNAADWKLYREYDNNNGLTVLKRVVP